MYETLQKNKNGKVVVKPCGVERVDLDMVTYSDFKMRIGRPVNVTPQVTSIMSVKHQLLSIKKPSWYAA